MPMTIPFHQDNELTITCFSFLFPHFSVQISPTYDYPSTFPFLSQVMLSTRHIRSWIPRHLCSHPIHPCFYPCLPMGNLVCTPTSIQPPCKVCLQQWQMPRLLEEQTDFPFHSSPPVRVLLESHLNFPSNDTTTREGVPAHVPQSPTPMVMRWSTAWQAKFKVEVVQVLQLLVEEVTLLSHPTNLSTQNQPPLHHHMLWICESMWVPFTFMFNIVVITSGSLINQCLRHTRFSVFISLKWQAWELLILSSHHHHHYHHPQWALWTWDNWWWTKWPGSFSHNCLLI